MPRDRPKKWSEDELLADAFERHRAVHARPCAEHVCPVDGCGAEFFAVEDWQAHHMEAHR